MRFRLPILIGLGLLIGAGGALLALPSARERLLPASTKVLGQAAVGGPFSLVDHNGKRVTDQDFRGRFMLVFFGFTFCPDICPTALQVASEALEKLGPKAARVTPVFITVDPERDTPEQMKSYVSSFHPSLVGLTGTEAETAAAAKAYRAYWRKVKDDKSTAGYSIDHTSIIYLMGPDGKFITHFTHVTSPDAMAAGIARHM